MNTRCERVNLVFARRAAGHRHIIDLLKDFTQFNPTFVILF